MNQENIFGQLGKYGLFIFLINIFTIYKNLKINTDKRQYEIEF